MDEQDQQEEKQSADVGLDQLQTDLDNAMNGWKRAAADFENYKKRKEGESKELVEFAREVTVAKLLPALDSLEQALKHMPELPSVVIPFMGSSEDKTADKSANYSPSNSLEQALRHMPVLPEGDPLAKQQGDLPLEGAFAKQYQNWQTGVNGIVIQLDKTLAELGVKKIEAMGKKFDPHFHEAVREVESEKDDGIIIDELQTGFELNGKVIRPSQVVISKKAESKQQ